MTNRARILMTGVAFTITLFTAVQTLAAEDGRADDHPPCGGPCRHRSRGSGTAEDEATRIYAAAGVRTVWAAEDEAAAVPGLHLRVILLCRDGMARRISGRSRGQRRARAGRASHGPRLHLHPQGH